MGSKKLRSARPIKKKFRKHYDFVPNIDGTPIANRLFRIETEMNASLKAKAK
jgi:hypothetical protein